MKLIEKNSLKELLFTIEEQLDEPSECILVGGAALLILTNNASATKDIDALPTESFDHFEKAARRALSHNETVDINTRSQMFEMNLPEDWESRIIRAEDFSRGNLTVYTPAPEDLAVMKLFRFAAKDAEDIAILSALPSFDQAVFLGRFVEVLKIAIGEPRWHAQSFCMIWNRLYPSEELQIEEIISLAGLDMGHRPSKAKS